MKTAIVCEKWELPIEDGESGFFAHTKIGELSRRALCFEWLLKDIPPGKSITEYFGGIGLQSVIIQELAQPSEHTIYDIDSDCVNQLRSIFKGKAVSIDQFDAREKMPECNSDIAILDFPDMTANKYTKWAEPLEGLFASRPKVVEITDVGNRYLHLWLSKYSEILGYDIKTIPDYITGISKYLYNKYEYSVFRAAYKSGTSYMLLANTPPDEIDLYRVGPNKSGFRYI